MQQLKYELEVTRLGELVSEFLDSGIIVFFGEQAPEELTDFAIIHNGVELKEQIVPGDRIYVANAAYNVLAVGDVANQNLANLGHLVMKFNGKTEPELPGDVCVEERPLPEITVGTTIKIVSEHS